MLARIRGGRKRQALEHRLRFRRLRPRRARRPFRRDYIDLDLKTAPVPESGPCLYKGVMVACGPPGLNGGKNILYHNNGNGTFTDVSETSGILKANGTYGLGVLAADLDNDGWPDIYVANDSTASALYKTRKRDVR